MVYCLSCYRYSAERITASISDCWEEYRVSLHPYWKPQEESIWAPVDRIVNIQKEDDFSYKCTCSCGGIENMGGPCRHLFCVVNKFQEHEACILDTIHVVWLKRSHEDEVVEVDFHKQDSVHGGEESYFENADIKCPKMTVKTNGYKKKSNAQTHNYI
jgi:hypothetical protein